MAGLTRSPRPAFAHDFGRHALTDFALSAAVRQQRIGGPAEHVDEAGRHRQIVGVHDGLGGRRGQVADGGNAIALDAHVGAARRIARAIVDGAAAD